MQFKNKKRKGFTIVEILIVVVIIGILAALVVPRMIDATKQAKVNSAMGQHRTVLGQINIEIAQDPTLDFEKIKDKLELAFQDQHDDGVVTTKAGVTTVAEAQINGKAGLTIVTTLDGITLPAGSSSSIVLP